MFQRKNKKKKKDYNLTYDNLAIPEIHTGNHPDEAQKNDSSTAADSSSNDTLDVITESVAVPEIRIHKKKENQ